MNTVFLLLLGFFLLGCSTESELYSKDTKELFLIVKNNRWGYIDATGKVVIPPKFRSAGQFSEGLAPVRLNGLYGFIDVSGDFVIQPIYDMAYPFEQGQAKVYINAKPYYIDTKGHTTFEHNFSDIANFDEHGLAVVKSQTGSCGVITRRGVLVVDTVFQEIDQFSHGVAVATGRNHNPYPRKGEEKVIEKGVVNANGDMVVPFGIYSDIREYRNGYAIVRGRAEHAGEKAYYEGMIDTEGKLRFTFPTTEWKFEYGNDVFSDERATVTVLAHSPDTSGSDSNSDGYKGILNANGDIVASNKAWMVITPFQHGRAFVADIHGNWFLINSKGTVLNTKPYREILCGTESMYRKIRKFRERRRRQERNGQQSAPFEGGIEFVRTEAGWTAIDTTGKMVFPPVKLNDEYLCVDRKGSIVFLHAYEKKRGRSHSSLYGFWDTKKGAIVRPQFRQIILADEDDSLMLVQGDSGMGYINRKGKYVWKAATMQGRTDSVLNIDVMNRGYYYASSPYKKELAGAGGWGRSRNNFKKITQPEKFEHNAFSLLVQTNEKAKYQEEYNGVKLYVANATKDTFYFAAQDSRLYLKLQARDTKGEWRDIEYLPNSWCGNSYHSLFLPPEHYWEFVVPVYDGEFYTRLRAELIYKREKKDEEEIAMYSNEFDGSVNPGQFWRIQPYEPSGLMDPYDE